MFSLLASSVYSTLAVKLTFTEKSLVDYPWIDRCNELQQEHTVRNVLVLERFDPALTRHAVVGPLNQLGIGDITASLTPIESAELPENTEYKSRFAISDVFAADVHDFHLLWEAIPEQLQEVVAVSNPWEIRRLAIKLILPVHDLRTEAVKYHQQDTAVVELPNQPVYLDTV